MGKSVYSLVLDDGLVACVDRLAYEKMTNRSVMINQILAAYFSYETPEQRTRRIFSQIQETLTGHECLRPIADPSETLLALRSSLVFKYNPTVRYSVELFRNRRDMLGELRVSMRTQNLSLLSHLQCFAELWIRAEAKLIGKVGYRTQHGKFTRALRGSFNDPLIGEKIGAYIGAFDQALKCYFADPAHPEEVSGRIEGILRQYLDAYGESV